MIIVLNGPLGVGKSTLAEALCERIEWCAMLEGDSLLAVNPPPADEIEHLHSAIALMAAHHRGFGYRHFVIDHVWTSGAQLDDLRDRLVDLDRDFRCFRLTLSAERNLERIRQRASTRAIDDLDYELRTVEDERRALEAGPGASLGEPFDASAPPDSLVARMISLLDLD